jgi:hypothetical protein
MTLLYFGLHPKRQGEEVSQKTAYTKKPAVTPVNF